MQTQIDISAKVREVIADHLGLGLETVTRESSLAKDLGADSLDRMELLMALEEEFRIEISDDEADRLKTVADVVAFVEKKAQ